MWDNLSIASAFETAVHSSLERQDVQTLWTEYLFYQRSKASQSKQSMNELINRCLMSVSTHSSLPHSSSAVWQDYRFHNQVSCFFFCVFFLALKRQFMGTASFLLCKTQIKAEVKIHSWPGVRHLLGFNSPFPNCLKVYLSKRGLVQNHS